MLPIKEFEKRFRDILSEMDEALETCEMDEDAAEALEELNAECEDALMLLAETDSSDEDFEDEMEDAFEEFEALQGDYSALSKKIPEIAPQVERLRMVIEMMRSNA